MVDKVPLLDSGGCFKDVSMKYIFVLWDFLFLFSYFISSLLSGAVLGLQKSEQIIQGVFSLLS